jgi:hypothetical protein
MVIRALVMASKSFWPISEPLQALSIMGMKALIAVSEYRPVANVLIV